MGVTRFDEFFRITKTRLGKQVFLLATIFGVLPYSRYEDLKMSFLLMGYCICLRVLLSFGMNIFLKSPIIDRAVTLFTKVTFIEHYVLMYVVINCSFILILLARSKFNRILNMLTRIDYKLAEYGIAFEYKPKLFWEAVYFFILCIPVFLMNFSMNMSVSSVVTPLFMIAELCMIFQTVQPFVELASILERRYCCLKHILSKMDYFSEGSVKKVEAAVQIHAELSYVQALTNTSYSVILVLMFAVIFGNMFAGVFRIYDSVTKGWRIIILACKVIAFSVTVILCWRITYHSRSVSRVAKEFDIMLYELMLLDPANQFSGNRKFRLHLASRREVVFTACGFFNIDYALVLSAVMVLMLPSMPGGDLSQDTFQQAMWLIMCFIKLVSIRISKRQTPS